MKQNYKILVDNRVIKELSKIPANDAKRIIQTIESLSENPRPQKAIKLINQPGWRIRKGVYRILYEIDDNKKIITVYRAGHRREIYRK